MSIQWFSFDQSEGYIYTIIIMLCLFHVLTSIVCRSLLILSLSCSASDSSICERCNATLNSDALSAERRRKRGERTCTHHYGSTECVVRLERKGLKSMNNLDLLIKAGLDVIRVTYCTGSNIGLINIVSYQTHTLTLPPLPGSGSETTTLLHVLPEFG